MDAADERRDDDEAAAAALHARLVRLLGEDATGGAPLSLAGADPQAVLAALARLDDTQIRTVFTRLDPDSCARLVASLPPEEGAEAVGAWDARRIGAVIATMAPRDAAGVVADVAPQLLAQIVRDHPLAAEVARDARNRRSFPPGTAGRLMTTDFVRLEPGLTVAEAIGRMRRTDPARDMPNNLYVVEAAGGGERLLGAVSLRDLVMSAPERPVAEVMATELATLPPEASDEAAAGLLSEFGLLALPVVDAGGHLLGIIPAEDAIRVVAARLRRLYVRSVGGDAEAMARMTPLEAARSRTPWLLGTMALELGAGLVIAQFDAVLERVILLASFMPVISAVSGNVGLQAAAITVRALDTGRLPGRRHALAREARTSLLMALVCGLVLGAIAALWSRHAMLALVIGVAMAVSMLTAGLMGTAIPILSKRLGFDPATTAGPFETAFQDVIGFAVFLGLATLMVEHIT